jgi:hypothetical protein
MATYADLKTRIADDLSRDDMGSGGEAESALVRAIASAVEQTANEEFYFSHSSGTAATVAGTGYVSVPASLRVVETVSYLDQPLIHVPLDSFESYTDAGLPTRWAQDGSLIRLWPVPDAVYSLAVYGTSEVAAPTLDADSNIWTNEAADLIAARAKIILCRFPLRDPEGLQMARDEERDALTALRADTSRRRRTPLRASDLEGRRYNINTDR